ncbi:MAG: hypothetical protein AAGD96_36410 [Chloroflexota bacterium]
MRRKLSFLVAPTLIFIFLTVSAACTLSTPAPTEVEVTRYEVIEVPIVETQVVEVTREVEVLSEIEVEVTREVPVTVMPTPVSAPGSAENPFKVIFLPTAAEELIAVRGGFLLEDLAAKTGYSYEAIIPTAENTAVDIGCSYPDTTIAMMSPEA